MKIVPPSGSLFKNFLMLLCIWFLLVPFVFPFRVFLRIFCNCTQLPDEPKEKAVLFENTGTKRPTLKILHQEHPLVEPQTWQR